MTASYRPLFPELTPYVPPTQGDATAVGVEPPAAARASILARVPTRLRVRVRLLEAKLDRERFVNAGLRARLTELDAERRAWATAVEAIVDEQARILGHAHPVITELRTVLRASRR